MWSVKCTGGLTRERGLEENVRNIWIMSISYSTVVHESIIKLSGVNIGSRDQDIDMGTKSAIVTMIISTIFQLVQN